MESCNDLNSNYRDYYLYVYAKCRSVWNNNNIKRDDYEPGDSNFCYNWTAMSELNGSCAANNFY